MVTAEEAYASAMGQQLEQRTLTVLSRRRALSRKRIRFVDETRRAASLYRPESTLTMDVSL